MSLTVVAAPIQPDPQLPLLPPSKPERFQRSDFIAAGLVFLITFGVYLATLAPSVTLEDSGELITGAAKFGVPHPPGYPLWTMSGFIATFLIPFGSLAWRINLESAFFGSAACAVLALLVSHSGRWLMQRWTDASHQPIVRLFCFYAALLAGLALGFSDVMWGEAVISEVYTLNALFVNLVLLLFYFWMLEPEKTHRLIVAVFVFALGLTNHHTLIQMIPAMLVAAALLRANRFWPVFLGVNLFSLSILVYLSWLSDDAELQAISDAMAKLILGLTAVVSFIYLKEFRRKLFLLGALTAGLLFLYGHYFMGPEKFLERNLHPGSHFWNYGSYTDPGWLQFSSTHGLLMLGLATLALGLLFTSTLDKRLIIGVFVAGWVGLAPYAYEKFASDTNPPMNWGYASERGGFYYAVSRQQYPMSLPNLIKNTIGKATRVVAIDEHKDVSLGLPNYGHRLWLTFYYYGDNLQDNFTVPLVFLTLAVLVYIRRCDARQMDWFIFLGVAFFFLGFMLHVIEPPEAFDFERNIQYKVFHLQSHCIFVLLLGYGALAAMTYLHEALPEIREKTGMLGFGVPALALSLLPLWSNFDDCNQRNHWYGYDYGHDMMKPMARNAIYFGGSDPGRFVPTYMAFVESQQSDRWKPDPTFDRRDIAVITQNALCDSFYCRYIRDQYDPRFRPKPSDYTPFEKWLGRDKAYPVEPVTCVSDAELKACWNEYSLTPEVAARLKAGGPIIRPGGSDVFELNFLVARRIFEKNKKDHTFYIEQSVAIPWMYPLLVPEGTIFRINPEPMDKLPADVIAADYKFWDDLSTRLLQDPKFRIDDDATITYAKLAFWHADLYRWRNLPKEEEHWLRLSNTLCPQLSVTVSSLARCLTLQKRFDEAIAVLRQAQLDDPRNERYEGILNWTLEAKTFDAREQDIHDKLARAPYDVTLNLDLAHLLQDEGKFDELNNRLRILAGLKNWTREEIGDIIRYFVDHVGNPDAAIAFLDARAKIDPTNSELIYALAALHGNLEHKEEALKFLTEAAEVGGSNALITAGLDPRFECLHGDPRFTQLLASKPKGTNPLPDSIPPATNVPPTPSPTNGAPLLLTKPIDNPVAPLPAPVKK